MFVWGLAGARGVDGLGIEGASAVLGVVELAAFALVVVDAQPAETDGVGELDALFTRTEVEVLARLLNHAILLALEARMILADARDNDQHAGARGDH